MNCIGDSRTNLKCLLLLYGAVLPVTVLLLLFNPALILWQQDFYPLPPAFWIKLATLSLGGSLLVAAVLALACWILRKFFQHKHFVPALLHALFLLLFGVTMFFPQASPLQDGSTAVEPSFRVMLPLYATYAALWIGITFFAVKQREITGRIVALAMFFCCGVSAWVAGITIYQYTQITFLSDKTDLAYGSEKNAIVIVADMLQGVSVEQAVKEYPDIAEKLPGFTLYPQAVSPFPFTTFAIPSILSGKVYATALPTTSSLNSKAAFADSMITDAEKAGFAPVTIGLFGNVIGNIEKTIYEQEEWIDNHASIQSLLDYIDLGIIRILKKRMLHANHFEVMINNKIFLSKMSGITTLQRLIQTPVGAASNRFYFHHNLFPHAPQGKWMFENKKYTSKIADQRSYSAYMKEIRFFFEQIGRLVNRLQELGIYDRSLIVIVGDHGHYNTPTHGASEIGWLGELDNSGFYARKGSLYNPALLVKLPNNTEQFCIIRDYICTTSVRQIVRPYLTEAKYKFDLGVQNKSIAFVKHGGSFSPYFHTDSHQLVAVQDLFSIPEALADYKYIYLPYTNIFIDQSIPFSSLSRYGDFIIEKNGGWLGKKGYICMRLNNVDINKDCVLSFKGFGLLKEGLHPEQKVKVALFDNVLPGELVFTSGKSHDSITIPASLLKKYEGKLALRLIGEDAVTPKKIGAWDWDDKPLSVFFTDVSATQKP